MSRNVALTGDIETCLALRRIVFICEQGVCEADEVDGLDHDAQHLLAVVDGVPVGTMRIIMQGETAKIGRVCVLVGQRKTGLGTAMIHKAVEICKDHYVVKRIILGSQIHALDFYKNLGFRAYSPVYFDAGIEHRDMELIL